MNRKDVTIKGLKAKGYSALKVKYQYDYFGVRSISVIETLSKRESDLVFRIFKNSVKANKPICFSKSFFKGHKTFSCDSLDFSKNDLNNKPSCKVVYCIRKPIG